jgi:hypothetical protein
MFDEKIMVNLRVMCVFGLYLTVLGANAADPSETCNDMYPADSYESEERYMLIQECMQAYSTDTASDPSADPGYYDGTVEDYVNQVPAEEPTPVE